jgi:hypothetical protein
MIAGSFTTVMRPRAPSPVMIGSSKCASIQVFRGFSRTALKKATMPSGSVRGFG